IVERCTEEAKIVAVEQQAKKEAEARAKAAGNADTEKFLAALQGDGSPAGEDNAEPAASDDDSDAEAGDSVPGAMEATDGASPEVTVHKEQVLGGNDELSPEEQAVAGAVSEEQAASRPPEDEEADVRSLAEGEEQPPDAQRRGLA